jgi:sigma-B regulation protein RsbU (phosphoserine phosphatase)
LAAKRKKREEELRQAKEAAELYSKTIETLNGISRELSALLNVNELLSRIGELLYQIVEYHSFSVMLLDSSGENLVERFSFSGSAVIENSDIPIGEGVVGFAARTRTPVLVGDVHRDPRYIKFHEETRSELSVPLIIKERLIGVLDIEHDSPDYFRADQVQAITILAAQLAIALDNAILYDRISRQERQLNRDLHFARVLQRRLLSADLPVMKNAAVSTLSWPARIIAGDIFDFAYHQRSRQHVSILGDVTGKGAPAAVYAALTCGIIRALLEREPEPTEMLKLINEALLERPLEAQFVALMYTLWDDSRLVLRIANSGLPKPVRYRNGRMEIIESIGMPLGLLAGVEYDEQWVAAAPGDVFVFLTDGILEAIDVSGCEFGYSGLESALSVSHRLSVNQIRDAIAKAVTSHCNCVEPVDDQTLIVFKVQKQSTHELRQPAENLRVRSGEFKLM